MRLGLRRIDTLLLLMVVIWGSNFTIVKVALREIPEHGFNTLRLVVVSTLFLIIDRGRSLPLVRQDWRWIVLLGVVGHFGYQLCFLGGLARTSVANCALILGWTPVAVALLTAALGHERVGPLRWVGVTLSTFGIYLVIDPMRFAARASWEGDLLSLGAVVCWTIYTVLSKPLLVRHSAESLTGYSMAVGTVLYAPFGLTDLSRLDWERVSLGAWLGLSYATFLALGVAYFIWFRAVQLVGPVRTSVFSNLNPLVAILVSIVWLREFLSFRQTLGATAILGGVALTLLESSPRPPEPDTVGRTRKPQ